MAQRNIDFIGKRKLAAIFSITIIVIGLLSIIMQGGLNYNIEFNGGYQLQAAFKNDVKIGELRQLFKQSELKGVKLQEFNDKNSSDGMQKEFVIKVETMKSDVKKIETNIISNLNKKYGKSNYIIRQASSIGPKIGDELKTSAVKAIIYALFGILIYITVKFEFKYAVAAIVALFHDVVITIGLLSVLGYFFDYEISLSVIAALMTIVGYSLNDTIVVFDRIRENKHKLEGVDFDRLINTSVNETFSRTILTSLTTLFVVFVLFLFGGDTIKDLSTALLIGVVIGTYSSIYVASPVVLVWDQFKKRKKKAGALTA